MNQTLDIIKARNQIQYCYHLMQNINSNIDDVETLRMVDKLLSVVTNGAKKKANGLDRDRVFYGKKMRSGGK